MKKILIFSLLLIITFILYFNSEENDKEFVSSTINYNGSKLMVSIDGVNADSLPSSGDYYLVSYKCSNDNTKVIWDRGNNELSISNGNKKGNAVCNLKFESKPLLSDMEAGSYVAYTGNGGTVGEVEVFCQSNGPVSSSVETAETESSNSCGGQNAREDLDNSGYTYGYCYSSKYKYHATGWRIAYTNITDVSNPMAVIISAGSPECNSKVISGANVNYIQMANTRALKYCNNDYVNGDCSCVDNDLDGYCDEASTDAWAVSDNDFYYMTKAISGFGKRLTDGSSNELGDVGGMLDSILYCNEKYSYQECGYNNSLIDNGGYYWFASRYSSFSASGVFWNPNNRYVSESVTSDVYGLRPVIKLSSTVYVTGGAGTMDDPYTIANDIV